MELSRALALEPTNVLAWLCNVVSGEKPTAAVGQEIAARHPGDWRAWMLALVALKGGGDPAALDHARGQFCALLAGNRAVAASPKLCPANLPASTL
jgi:hypothetical protein